LDKTVSFRVAATRTLTMIICAEFSSIGRPERRGNICHQVEY
jgi:hypothetical protein